VCMTCPHVSDTEATEHCNEMVGTVATVCRQDVFKLICKKRCLGLQRKAIFILLSLVQRC